MSTQAFLRAMHREDVRAVQAVGRALAPLGRAADAVAASLRSGGRLIYVGAGTSGRLCALDAAECPPTFGVAPGRIVALVAGGSRALRRAVEGAEDAAAEGGRALRRVHPGPTDTVVGVTASGDTPYVMGALRAARRAGSSTVVVCSAVTAEARALADVLVPLETGAELLQGSTRLKAGTAAKLALNMLSTRALAASGHVLLGRMVELRPTSAKLRRRGAGIVAELAGLPLGRAASLLDRAGSVKLALVMAARGVGRPSAARLLRAAGGDVRAAVGENFLRSAARR